MQDPGNLTVLGVISIRKTFWVKMKILLSHLRILTRISGIWVYVQRRSRHREGEAAHMIPIQPFFLICFQTLRAMEGKYQFIGKSASSTASKKPDPRIYKYYRPRGSFG